MKKLFGLGAAMVASAGLMYWFQARDIVKDWKPANIGKFEACPNKPNCVSTSSSSNQHSIEPFKYKVPMGQAKERLLRVIVKMPRSRVVTKRENFIHVEFMSRFLRFVDDVEFYFEEPGIISYRSASRVGHSDFGVNRERMEKIRALLKEIEGVA